MNDEGRTTKDIEKNTQRSTLNAQRAVELHIEKLVLHGFDSGDRYRIGAAVEAELTRLFAEQGVPPSLARVGEIPYLDGARFEVSPDSTAEAIGSQMAQALYGGLNR